MVRNINIRVALEEMRRLNGIVLDREKYHFCFTSTYMRVYLFFY